MQLVLQYERLAAECREIAAETTNARFKKQLEDMAEVWEGLAAQRRRVRCGRARGCCSKLGLMLQLRLVLNAVIPR